MRSSLTALARVPMIKFVGGKHPRPDVIDASMKAHPMSTGIVPGGEGALKISELVWPKHEKPKPQPQSQPQAKSSLPTSSKPYDYVSVLDLPKRFQTPAWEQLEMDVINSGGADLLL